MQGCNPRAVAGRSGQTHRAGGVKPPASSPEQRRIVALHAARYYVESDSTHLMDIDHVVALLRAGEDVPAEVLRKFPALKPGKKKRELSEVLA